MTDKELRMGTGAHPATSRGTNDPQGRLILLSQKLPPLSALQNRTGA